MASLKRRIMGITVISAGVCAALPFRNEAVDSPIAAREEAEFPDAATSQHELTLQLTIPASTAADPTAGRGQYATSAVLEKGSTPLPQEIVRDELQAPPKIATAFQPLVTTFPAATEEVTPPTNFDKPMRRHRIADGDTLEAIAERYLGSRSQWRSIYESNDGLLKDRDILPIGKEIKIPRAPSPSRDDDHHLVPIPAGLLNLEER